MKLFSVFLGIYGWRANELVNVHCPEDVNYELCMSVCGSLGLNNTIAYYDSYCLPRLPAGQPILITRDKRYGTASGKLTYHGSALDDIYHTNLGFLWGIELLEPVDLTHWDRIKKVTLFLDFPPVMRWARNIIAQSPLYLYRANVVGPHFKEQMGSGNDMPGYKDQNVIVSQLNIDHPDYKAMSWDTVDQPYKSLNLTKWFRWVGEHVGELGQGLVIRQPSLEDFSGSDRSEQTVMGSDALLYIDVHEEVWVAAAPHCASYMNCDDCRSINGCHWCLVSNAKNICTHECDTIWINDDLCAAKRDTTSTTRKPLKSDTITSSMTRVTGSSSVVTQSQEGSTHSLTGSTQSQEGSTQSLTGSTQSQSLTGSTQSQEGSASKTRYLKLENSGMAGML